MLTAHRFFRLLAPIAVSLISLALLAQPSRSAEEVLLQLGPANRAVTVAELEAFLENGSATGLLRYLNQDQQDYLRLALTQSQNLNIVPLANWLNSPMGERTLQFAGQLFQTGARFNGQKAIRAAIITSLADDSEVSALELIKNYPSRELVVDISQGIEYGRQAFDDVNTTLAIIAIASEQSAADAEVSTSFDLKALPNLIDEGPYAVELVELELEDDNRQRRVPADLFLPQNVDDLQTPIPLLVLSHGLGDSRTSFHGIARHLASHGIATVLPEHVGSNAEQKEAMLGSLSNETFLASEFLDRPLDITFLLDELEGLSETDFQGLLGLDRVAVVGHSFGGYTAFALAGATISFEELERRCSLDANIAINTASLLECRALELTDNPETVEALGEAGVRDERIAAIMGFAPVTRLFGESGVAKIDIPTAIVGGAYDVVSPVVEQQATAFSWLQTPDKYFYLAEQGSHSRETTLLTTIALNIVEEFDKDIEESDSSLDLTTFSLSLSEEFEQEVGEAIQLLQGVNVSLVIGFTHVHILGQPEYTPYLTASYVEAVSQPPYNMNLLRQLPESAVELIHQN